MQDPYTILTKGVDLFHTAGEQRARAYVNGTLRSPKWQTTRMKTKSDNAISAFASYCAKASNDSRPATVVEGKPAVPIGELTVAAPCNVVLMEDDGGYVGRICHWGLATTSMTVSQLELLAVPTVLYLQAELPDDLVHGVEIWNLRSDREHFVTTGRALARRADLRAVLNRLA